MQSAIENYPQLGIVPCRAVEEVSQLKKKSMAELHRLHPQDNEKSQRQPQKKGKSSIIDSGEENQTLMHERTTKETIFVPTSELLVCLLCFNEFSSHDIVLHTK